MQNFGEIKNLFNGILVEGVIARDEKKKDIFKKYVKAINENRILKTQFLVYNSIENRVEADENKAIEFIKESIDLFSKFDTRQIEAVNTELLKLANSTEDLGKTPLYEDIAKLIFTKKTPYTIDEIVNTRDRVVKYIMGNKPKEISEAIELPNSMISNIMVDKYNEKYASLDETEKSLLRVLTDSTEEQKKDVYSKILRECIDLINEQLIDSELEVKDKLLRVKDKLLNDKKEITEDFIKNVSKLIELRGSLKK